MKSTLEQARDLVRQAEKLVMDSTSCVHTQDAANRLEQAASDITLAIRAIEDAPAQPKPVRGRGDYGRWWP